MGQLQKHGTHSLYNVRVQIFNALDHLRLHDDNIIIVKHFKCDNIPLCWLACVVYQPRCTLPVDPEQKLIADLGGCKYPYESTRPISLGIPLVLMSNTYLEHAFFRYSVFTTTSARHEGAIQGAILVADTGSILASLKTTASSTFISICLHHSVMFTEPASWPLSSDLSNIQIIYKINVECHYFADSIQRF